MSILVLVAFGAVAAGGMVAIVSFEFGRRSVGVYRLYKRRPLTYAQFDSAMSKDEMIAFLLRSADLLREQGLVEAHDSKNDCSDD